MREKRAEKVVRLETKLLNYRQQRHLGDGGDDGACVRESVRVCCDQQQHR